jgi:hypothetical protein
MTTKEALTATMGLAAVRVRGSAFLSKLNW